MSDKSYNALLASWQEKIAAAPIDTLSSDAGLQTELDRLYAEYPKLPKKLPEKITDHWAAQQLSKPGFLGRLGQIIATPFDWFVRETSDRGYKTKFADNAIVGLGFITGAAIAGGLALAFGAAPIAIGIAALATGGVNALMTHYQNNNPNEFNPLLLPTWLAVMGIGVPLHYFSKLASNLCNFSSNNHNRKLDNQLAHDLDFQLDCTELASAARRAAEIQTRLGTKTISQDAINAATLQQCANLLERRLIKTPDLAEMEAPNYLWTQPNLDHTSRALKDSIAERINHRDDIVRAVAELEQIEPPAAIPLPTAPDGQTKQFSGTKGPG